MMKLVLLLLAAAAAAGTLDFECNEHLCHEFQGAPSSRGTPVYFALKQNQKGVEKLRKYILEECSNIDSPNYGKYLDIDTIQRMVQPSYTAMNSAMSWIRRNTHLDTRNCELLGDSIRCFTDEQYPQFHRIRELDKTLFDFVEYPTSSQSKPLSFWRPTKRNYKFNVQSNNSTADLGYVSREVLLEYYNMPTVGGQKGFVNKNKVSVGSMEYQGQSGFSQSDIVIEQLYNDVPVNKVSESHIVGVNQQYPDGESELDMGVMWWSAANADLWYEDWKGWMFSWAQDFLQRSERPQVVSLSWGWNERDQCQITSCDDSQTYVERTDVEFMKMAALGTTIVVASGDAGSPGRTNEMCDATKHTVNPVFPGCSEWVLSVGATFVSTRYGSTPHEWDTPVCDKIGCVNGTTEEMTTFRQTGWTSGSGFSAWTDTPKWQKAHVERYLNSGVHLPDRKNFNSGGRAYPDVSTFGHACSMYVTGEGGWISEDGTSCSAPIMAGIVTYLNNYQLSRGKSTVGFVNPLLYKMYENDKSSFHDIQFGNSSCTESACCNDQFGFLPKKGMWDVVSGLGTPDISKLVDYLSKR